MDFQDGDHGSQHRFLIETISATFDLQVTQIFPTKLSQLHFGSVEEVQNRFSRRPPWWPSWISKLYYFSYFSSNSHLGTSNEGFKSISLSVKEKNYKIYFQISIRGSHLGFPTGTIKILFIYKLARYFLPSFESIRYSVQEKSSKYIFRMGMTNGIYIQEKKFKIDFQEVALLDFRSE